MKNIVLIWFFMIGFIWGCSNPNETNLNSLSGEWSETYVWDGSLIKNRLEPPDSLLDDGISRTTTLDFSDDRITVTVLPPYRILSYSQNSSYIRLSDDTLYTGTYSTNDSILYLHLDIWDDLVSPAPYRYELFNNNLSVSTPSRRPAIASFLWGDSFNKTSGVFKRN